MIIFNSIPQASRILIKQLLVSDTVLEYKKTNLTSIIVSFGVYTEFTFDPVMEISRN